MAKIENPLLLSLYAQWVDGILAETDNIEDANERLRELGREMGSHIYLNTEIAEKTKDTVMTREDVSKLVETIYKVLFNKKPTDIDMKTARGSVRVTDDECVWCQDVTLEGMRGFGYCEGFSGIVEAILRFKGVEAEVFQESCRATGAGSCTWNIRL
ncbi:MAG: hypothetical protein EAX81_05345 [Candidatus Thorarchaeota archaeon]|nr:hypothetical protein [Candidatus Thorarchaeota archaeon]